MNYLRVNKNKMDLEDIKEFLENELEQIDLHDIRDAFIAAAGYEGAKAILSIALDKITKELEEEE